MSVSGDRRDGKHVPIARRSGSSRPRRTIAAPECCHQQRRRLPQRDHRGRRDRRDRLRGAAGLRAVRRLRTRPRRASSPPVSPVVGTVNLKKAQRTSTGAALPNTDITWRARGGRHPAAAQQRDADRRLHAAGIRRRACARSAPSSRSPTRPSPPAGSSSNDGTRLWPDLDGRPSMAGKARIPLDPNTRNIYTYIPDGSGGGSMVAFTPANASTLAPHMGTSAPTTTTLITARSRAAHRRDHRIDAGDHGRAVARSAARRRLRPRRTRRARSPATTTIAARSSSSAPTTA